MIKFFLIIILSFLLFSCSDNITTYYSYEEFDILKIGANLTELIISPSQEILVAADEGNNRLIFIDISKMRWK